MAKKLEKIRIRETRDVTTDIMDREADNIIEFLNEMKKETGADDIYIESEIDHGWYDEVSVQINASWSRDETDEEFAIRGEKSEKAKATAKKAAATKKANKKIADRAEWERLQELFGE